MIQHHRTSRHGFTAVDLAAVLVVCISVTAIAAPTLHGAWRNRMATGSASNLHTLGIVSAMYSANNDAKIPTYTWEGDVSYFMPHGVFMRGLDDQGAASLQNREILMRMTGQIEPQNMFRSFNQRVAHKRFIHLILWDFMGSKTSREIFVDPLDTNMLTWHHDPLNFGIGSTVPYANGNPGPGYDSDGFWTNHSMRQRWPYASSYFAVPAAWMSQGADVQYGPIESSMNLFRPTGNGLDILHDGNRLTDVAFPGSKVYMHEEYDRRQGFPTHYAYDHARPLKLMFDGSLNSRPSGEANSSYDPVTHTPWAQPYIPMDTYPVPIGGLGDPTELNMRYRWTRHGLSGIDYTP